MLLSRIKKYLEEKQLKNFFLQKVARAYLFLSRLLLETSPPWSYDGVPNFFALLSPHSRTLEIDSQTIVTRGETKYVPNKGLTIPIATYLLLFGDFSYCLKIRKALVCG